MNEWVEYTLSELTSRIGDGLHGTPQYDDNGDYYFINGNNIKNGKVELKTETKRVTEAVALSYAKPINKETILLSINGTIGNLGIYNGEQCMLGKSVCYINPNSKVESKFLYYNLLNQDFQNFLELIATGTTIPNVPLKGLREYTLSLPPISEQQAIAEVLSSIDDKIDLLHRNNKTLEEMAETLFRQWFVEGAKEDWEDRPLLYFGKIICGKTPSTSNKNFFEGSIPFVKIPDMHGNIFIFNTTTTLTETGVNSQPKKTIPIGAIMVSCIATVGLVAISTTPCQTNQQINTIVPREPHYKYFLFLALKNMKDELKALAGGGSVTDNLNTSNFSNVSINTPKEELLMSFNGLVDPIFDKIKHNARNIIALSQLRDTLLPKLMSGQVRVNI
jgi:type I restriction enzyme S subunit